MWWFEGVRGLGDGGVYGWLILYLDNKLLKECNICFIDFVWYVVVILINEYVMFGNKMYLLLMF